MIKYLLILPLIFISKFAWCQPASGFEIPPNSTNSYNWCAPNSNILVFYDEFDGSTLAPHWNTFGSYKGMWSENDNWLFGRGSYVKGNEHLKYSGGIIRDENVSVSNGIVSLSSYKELNGWKCDTCSSTDTLWSHFSRGQIALPYNSKALHHGTIEIKARMDDFKYAHHALWLWTGMHCNNEIDIIEAYGRRSLFNNDLPHGTWNTHEWNGQGLEENCKGNERVQKHYDATLRRAETYMRHAYNKNRFGREPNIWNKIVRPNQIFDMTAWHTYLLDWDSTEVIFKLDGFEVGAIPKWYKHKDNDTDKKRVYPSCIDNNFTYKFNNAFPWDKVSFSQLRIGSGVYEIPLNSDLTGSPNLDDGHLGDVKVDYVKIWQSALNTGGNEHPVWMPWTDPCDASGTVQINGRKWLCYGSTDTYTVTGLLPGGIWELPLGFETTSSLTDQSIIITRSNWAMYTNGVLVYKYKLSETCPEKTIRFNIYCNIDGIMPAQPTVVPIVDNYNNRSYFFFDNMEYVGISRTEHERKKYSWTLTFEYPDTNIVINKEGRFFEINAEDVDRTDLTSDGLMDFNLKMELTIEFPFEETALTVEKFIPTLLSQTSVYPLDGDSSVTLWHAAITDVDSFNAEWDLRVEDFLFWDYELDNPIYLEEIRHQIKSEMLIPYVLEMQDSSSTISYEYDSKFSEILHVYPNPNNGNFSIRINHKNDEKITDMSLHIYNMYGQQVFVDSHLSYEKNINLTNQSNGIYVIILKLNGENIAQRKFFIDK